MTTFLAAILYLIFEFSIMYYPSKDLLLVVLIMIFKKTSIIVIILIWEANCFLLNFLFTTFYKLLKWRSCWKEKSLSPSSLDPSSASPCCPVPSPAALNSVSVQAFVWMLSEPDWEMDPTEKWSPELYFRLISFPAPYTMRFIGICADTE